MFQLRIRQNTITTTTKITSRRMQSLLLLQVFVGLVCINNRYIFTAATTTQSTTTKTVADRRPGIKQQQAARIPGEGLVSTKESVFCHCCWQNAFDLSIIPISFYCFFRCSMVVNSLWYRLLVFVASLLIFFTQILYHLSSFYQKKYKVDTNYWW